MKRRACVIIQARMGSTRLPGKVLKELCEKPMLYHIIQRTEQTAGIDTIMVATSIHQEDDPVAAYASDIGLPCFRGSEEDVLERFYGAAKALGVGERDVIVRLTADNPFVDPVVLQKLLTYFEECPYSYASTSGYPLGLGGEVFTFRKLEEAFQFARKQYEREHVTPYMYRNADEIGQIVSPKNYSQYRFTVDTPEDFAFARAVYDVLYHGKHDFYLDDIIKLLGSHPEIQKINCNVHQKQLGE